MVVTEATVAIISYTVPVLLASVSDVFSFVLKKMLNLLAAGINERKKKVKSVT